MHPTYDDYAALYQTTLNNFFRSLHPESAEELKGIILTLADEVTTTVQWYMASTSIQAKEVFAAIRADSRVFTCLVKLERLFLTNLALNQWDKAFLQALTSLHHSETPNLDIVDKDFADALAIGRRNNLPAMEGVPGFIGLYSILMFRHCWESPRAGGAKA